MNKTTRKHLAAIKAGEVTKTNIIGMHKALNALARTEMGYSTSRTSPSISAEDRRDLLLALSRRHPHVAGELHDSGVEVLRNRRYDRRWTEAQRAVIGTLDHFELIGFAEANYSTFTPVYRVVGANGIYFDFVNIPWQSGGDGPRVLTRS